MPHSSYIEISKSALQNNINFIRHELGPDIILSSVIKGNAYGHGIEQFAPLAQTCGINHFCVFSADEAQRLLNIINQPITVLIMGYLDATDMSWAIEHQVEFYVFDVERLETALKVAQELNKKAIVHLEIETGMNRTGLDAQEIEQASTLLKNNKNLVCLKGVCTHFAGAESLENQSRIKKQFTRFNEALEKLKANGLNPEMVHSACSAAMISYPQTRLNMVRIGIMQYGFWPSPETFDQFKLQRGITDDPLRRLINWKSSIMSLKQVSKGENIGYGSSYQAYNNMRLAIVPVGYAWGYSRSLSNQGHVLIKGEQAPVVGIVNMNIITVDITHISDVRLGEEVVLLGKQIDKDITVASFAELSTQLNYELLTRLPLNIPRYTIE